MGEVSSGRQFINRGNLIKDDGLGETSRVPQKVGRVKKEVKEAQVPPRRMRILAEAKIVVIRTSVTMEGE